MRDMHPTWEYRLWTDEANRELVRDHYPWLLETYDSFPENIMRADTARVLYLHKYGGLYADLDFEVLQPFDKLLDKDTLVLAAMTDDSSFNHRIPNAWMASVPEHPFWQFCIRHIIAAATPCAWQPKKKWFGLEEKRKWDWVEEVTGPPMLLKAIESYNATALGPLKVLPPGIIYPIDWRLTSRDWKKSGSVLAKGVVPTKRPGQHEVCDPRQSGFSELACKAKFPDAYAITYWMHSW
ncbi:g1813 [Coccomyxa elongata]